MSKKFIVVCLSLLVLMACQNQKTKHVTTTSDTTQSTLVEEPNPIYGFKVSGTKLLDANNNEFVMRGINYPHTWYKGYYKISIPAIANTGANTIRVVLSNGKKWQADHADKVKELIELSEENQLVVVLEVHDATGSDQISDLKDATNYFIQIKDVLIGKESTVIINIANEWYGSWKGETWRDGYNEVIPMLREAGLNHTIMVDAAGWGQYPKSIHDYGLDVLNADPIKNTMFSIHMYEYSGGNASTIKTNIDHTLNKGLALVIGEFGFKHSSGDVDEATIMSYSQTKGVGYIGWSWKGNGGGVEYLDLSNDWQGTNLTTWGEILINGANGIKETSIRCSIYTND